jgi:hypothetical protein
VLQADSIIHARIVHQRVQMPNRVDDRFNRRGARFCHGQFRCHKFARPTRLTQFSLHRFPGVNILIHDHRNRAFPGAFADDRRSDSF